MAPATSSQSSVGATRAEERYNSCFYTLSSPWDKYTHQGACTVCDEPYAQDLYERLEGFPDGTRAGVPWPRGSCIERYLARYKHLSRREGNDRDSRRQSKNDDKSRISECESLVSSRPLDPELQNGSGATIVNSTMALKHSQD